MMAIRWTKGKEEKKIIESEFSSGIMSQLKIKRRKKKKKKQTNKESKREQSIGWLPWLAISLWVDNYSI